MLWVIRVKAPLYKFTASQRVMVGNGREVHAPVPWVVPAVGIVTRANLVAFKDAGTKASLVFASVSALGCCPSSLVCALAREAAAAWALLPAWDDAAAPRADSGGLTSHLSCRQ